MTTQPQPDALRLAGALLEPVVLDKHAMQAADELLRLHAECETLRQANVAFAARQAWWNDRMVALEAECEALRVDALRWRVMREALIAIDFAWNSPPMSVAIFENHSNECFAGPECADAIADAALARNKEQSNG